MLRGHVDNVAATSQCDVAATSQCDIAHCSNIAIWHCSQHCNATLQPTLWCNNIAMRHSSHWDFENIQLQNEAILYIGSSGAIKNVNKFKQLKLLKYYYYYQKYYCFCSYMATRMWYYLKVSMVFLFVVAWYQKLILHCIGVASRSSCDHFFGCTVIRMWCCTDVAVS